LDDPVSLILDTQQIPPDGLRLNGELANSVLELNDADGARSKANVAYDLMAMIMGPDILVTGNASTAITALCDRCAADFEMALEPPPISCFIEQPYPQEIDLVDDIREALLILIPHKCLCKADCAGLCGQCGINLNNDTCGCAGEPEAPSAWSELDGLSL
jgi:uncharacterized metal-binding protein YceD (DUF177 family)